MKSKIPNTKFQIPNGLASIPSRRSGPVWPINSRQGGYSLIEILVGLVIISILFIGGYAGYQQYARRQVVNNAAKEFKERISLARQKALSGEKPAGCTETLLGFEVVFTENSYTISPSCDLTSPGAGSGSVISITLPDSVTLDTSGFTSPLLFKPVSGTNLSGEATITLTYSVTGTTQQIIINTNGSIE